MWFRNNLCTILCNGSENFLFYLIAFGGVEGFDIGTIVSIGASATVIEILIALCDTPFLYIAKHVKDGDLKCPEVDLKR